MDCCVSAGKIICNSPVLSEEYMQVGLTTPLTESRYMYSAELFETFMKEVAPPSR